MEPQATSSPSDIKAPVFSESSLCPSNKKIHAFDCPICYETLTKSGPPLECFTFGRLLINFSELSFLERQLVYRDFSLADQCFTNGFFDCDKIVVTICGHIFHGGCIREWFFMRRFDMRSKCPFCNQITSYDECRVIHPLALDEEDDGENECDKTSHDTEYSDISCSSSSWPSDDEGTAVSEMGDVPDDFVAMEAEMRDFTDKYGPVVANQFNNDLTSPPFEAEEIQEAEFQNLDPPFLSPSTYEDPMKTSEGKVKYFPKLDFLHLFTLLCLIYAACQRFKTRKEEFLADQETLMDNMEDEGLACMENMSIVPLGYDFIYLGLVTGVAVFIWECFIVR